MAFKFRVLRGRHAESIVPEGSKEPVLKIYNKGDVLISESELDVKFNSPGSVKFERLAINVAMKVPSLAEITASNQTKNDSSIQSTSDADLQNKTVTELKALAAEFEIDLGNASKKDEIISKLIAAGI